MARKPVGWRGESERHRQAALKGREHLERDAMRWAIDPYIPKVIPPKLRDLAVDAGWISPMQDMVDEFRKGTRLPKEILGDYLTLAEDSLDMMRQDLYVPGSKVKIDPAGFSKAEIARMKRVVDELARMYKEASK